MNNNCYLCDGDAEMDKGVIFYRYYDQYARRWVSKPMCFACWVKLKGPIREEGK